MLKRNKVLLYILIFSIFYILSEGSSFISEYLNVNKYLMLIVSAIIFTCIMYLVNTSLVQKDGFHFELTPEKKCDGGDYMYTSNPSKQQLCKSFSQSDLSKYSCCGGFHGRPVWYNRTDESNSDWENTMCDKGLNDYDSHVL